MGAMHLGQAVLLLWRNIEAHEVTDTGRQQALEALSAMSAFPRLVDNAKIVTVHDSGTAAS